MLYNPALVSAILMHSNQRRPFDFSGSGLHVSAARFPFLNREDKCVSSLRASISTMRTTGQFISRFAILDTGRWLTYTCQDCGKVFQFTTEDLSAMSATQLMTCLEAHGCQEIQRQASKATGAA